MDRNREPLLVDYVEEQCTYVLDSRAADARGMVGVILLATWLVFEILLLINASLLRQYSDEVLAALEAAVTAPAVVGGIYVASAVSLEKGTARKYMICAAVICLLALCIPLYLLTA